MDIQFRVPDYVNFKSRFNETQKYEKFNRGFGTRKDLRTGLLTVKEQSCNEYQLIKNYIDLLADTSKWNSIVINNQKFKCYSFLEFGMIPIILLPIGIFQNEQMISEDMLQYATNVLGLEATYQIPVIDFFTGIWRTTLGKNDVWTSREALAKALNKTPQTVHVADFFESYVNYTNTLRG